MALPATTAAPEQCSGDRRARAVSFLKNLGSHRGTEPGPGIQVEEGNA